MSLLILPPPARLIPVFDDGALWIAPPPVFDEDVPATPFSLRAQVYAQPIADDADRPLSARIVDEDYLAPLPPWTWRIYAQPQIDEADRPLTAIALDEDSGQPALTLSARSSALQLFYGDDDLAQVVVTTIVDDDVAASLAVLRAAIWSQPFIADEDLPLGAIAPPDESAGVPLQGIAFSVTWRPLALEDDLPPQSVAPALEDELQFAQFAIAQAIVRQPASSDDDLPIAVVLNTLDEDYTLSSVRVSLGAYSQPFTSDEDLPLRAKIVDEERTDHWLLQKSISVVWQQPPFAAFDEIGGSVHFRGQVFTLKPRDMRITLLPPDRTITLRSSTTRRITLTPGKPKT